jgi:hypothetical protein
MCVLRRKNSSEDVVPSLKEIKMEVKKKKRRSRRKKVFDEKITLELTPYPRW